jgi:hypothetical protein
MGGGVPLSKGTWVGSQNPNDAKYFNDTQPWASIEEVLAGIPIGERHIGLPVNVNKVEYTFKDGIEDADLVINQPEAPDFSETVLVPIQNLDEQEVDLTINNYDNVFRLNTFSDNMDLKISIPLGSENFMCYIHLVHKGTQSKSIQFLTTESTIFNNNTLKSNNSQFSISGSIDDLKVTYSTIIIYVHKIGIKWNVDYKYSQELSRTYHE